ncbi:MAG: DUF4863 domain-containing protein [Planctomycetota bacterium]|nr:MAG: DUF4863 domain-containing protein [Planctomycetota bacterium]
MKKDELRSAVEALVPELQGIDLSAADAAAQIEARLPFASEQVQEIGRLFEAADVEGELMTGKAGSLRYGRLAKDLGGFSVDAVWMDGPGPLHKHPGGEIDLCFRSEGEGRFDGQEPGWTVYGPDSQHVPTVRNGAMRILYFLPGGLIEFLGG